MKTESRVNAGSITARVVADVDFVSNNHARIIYVLSSTIPLPPPCFVSFTVASIDRPELSGVAVLRAISRFPARQSVFSTFSLAACRLRECD